jgi:hypothetical protein
VSFPSCRIATLRENRSALPLHRAIEDRGPGSLRAETGVFRYEAILHRDFAHRRRLQPELLDGGTRQQTLCAAINHERGDSPQTSARFHVREQDKHVGNRCVRDHGLRPIEHVAVLRSSRSGTQRERVGTRVGLRHAVSADQIPVAKSGNVAPLLFVRSEFEQRMLHTPHLSVQAEQQASICAAATQPFHQQHRVQEAARAAAEALGRGSSENTELGALSPSASEPVCTVI